MSDSEETQLATTQRWMVEQLQRRRALPSLADSVVAARRHATGNDVLQPVDQVEIYRQQFWLRHTSSLVEDFPGLGGILGQRDWERLVEGYLEENSPRGWTLRNLGELMPAYVAKQSWLPQRELCEDMAQLEWAYIRLFDAAEATKHLDPKKVASVAEDAWNRAVLELDPSLLRLSSRYPVARLRRDLRAAEESGASVPIPEPSPQELVLYRHQRSMYFEVLSAAQAALYDALAEGMALVPAAEHAVAAHPDQASTIEAGVGLWFQRWATLGWVIDVHV